MADNTADVIVVGGGIAGCSAAYYLSASGHSVILFERDEIAAHASGFAFGVLLPRLFDNPNDPVDALTRLSLDLHRQIASEIESGGDKVRTEKASVLLATDEGLAAQYRGLYRSGAPLLGDVRWLEHGELSHIEARISPEVTGGLYLGDTAEIDLSKYCPAVWRVAEGRGARLVKADVESVSADGDGVTVTADGETYSAGRVVVAAGPWTSSLLNKVGAEVPVGPLKGQIVRLDAPGPPMKVSLWWGSDYAGSKPDGLLWCGTTEERVGFDDEPTPAAREGILASAVKILPFLREARVARQTACLRPVSADGLPIVGTLPGNENIVVATGGGRNGIVLGPSLGRLAADFATGTEPSANVAGLSPSRFMS